jgi:hypothetical protein
MLDFHYQYMIPKYGDKCSLLYTDTDSFVYEVETEDLFKDMYDNKEHFDLSASAIKHFKATENKSVIGKFKCETNMRPIKEWIALKSKMYSFICDIEKETTEIIDETFITTKTLKTDCEKHKCKGITKNTKISHNEYVKCNTDNLRVVKSQRGFQVFNHQIFTVEFEKVALSSFDDKMFRIDSNVAYPYGHKQLI